MTRLSALATFAVVLATNAAADVVTARWNRNPEGNVQTYLLSYGIQSDTYTTTIDVGNVTSHQFTITPGSRYYFVVQAQNTAGLISLPSAEATLDLTLALNPTALNFGAVNAAGTLTAATPAQTLIYTQGASSSWTASVDQPWLALSRTSGSGSASIQVSVNNAGGVLPPAGALVGTVTVISQGVARSTTVRLNVIPAGQPTAAPFGFFDTPLAGTTIQGSIAVTGWALDDIAVDHVEIWRDLMPGETTTPFSGPGHPGHGKVFIARPLFISGSRTDVQTTYASHPFADRAGWGYLLLTWGLWNQGNGPVTLHAFAFDVEGYATVLGSKTVTASNSNATRPFGGIDVPAFGETKSGLFFNFGWALTPNPNSADNRTCTITNGNVFAGIDSGPLIPVSYGDSRTDIAGAFPGFSNGSNGGGHLLIDTTTLTNGTHQIGWLVTDSCGRADGIGSRFFSVLNGSSLQPATLNLTAGDAGASESEGSGGIERNVLRVRRNLGDWSDVPGTGGRHVVAVGQNDRIEVQLPLGRGVSYRGSQTVNGEPGDLPLGASLDARKGIFYWQPAPGFLGSFDLEFAPDGPRANRPSQTPLQVRVVVGPPMRMAIDTPQNGAVAERPIVISGWAIDLAAVDGSGVDTVHVWAFPAAGGHPIFLGVADIGDARHDVAATFGATFRHSSYTLVTSSLPKGTFDLVVYPHRAATGSFEGPQNVRIDVQ